MSRPALLALVAGLSTIAALTAAAVYLAVRGDEAPAYTGPVTVVEREYTPSRPHPVITGKVVTVIQHPESYRLRVCTPDATCWTQAVARALHDVAHEGTTIHAERGALVLPEGARP